MMATHSPSVAILLRGAPASVSPTARALRDCRATLYLLFDSTPPAECFNRAAAMRTEDWLGFWDAGWLPVTSNWLAMLMAAHDRIQIGAVQGIVPRVDPGGPLFTRRSTFELLGGFDADRYPQHGFLADYLSRLIGLGQEIARAEVEFLAGSPQLRTAAA